MANKHKIKGPKHKLISPIGTEEMAAGRMTITRSVRASPKRDRMRDGKHYAVTVRSVVVS